MASMQDKEQKVEGHDVSVGKEHDPEERPGVMGSVMRAVQSAKEAVVGKSRDEHGRRDEGDVDYYAGDGGDRSREKAREAAGRAIEAKERTGEMTDKAKEAARETKDYTAEKARETAEKTKETAESAKEKAHEAKAKTEEAVREAEEKTNETAQSAADKTKETTQSATSKLGELKDKAMGLFSGKEDAEEKLRETDEETRRRMEELRLKGRDEYEGDVAQRVGEDKDDSERRGGGILGALGSLKEKLTSRPTLDKSRTVEDKEVVVMDASAGGIESTLKAFDQTVDDEGVVRLDRGVKK